MPTPAQIEALPIVGTQADLDQYMEGMDHTHWFGIRVSHFLRFEATGLYDSNTLRNDLVTGLWRGGEISRETRQRSESTKATTNRAGFLLEGELSYAWGDSLFGEAGMRPRLSVAYRDVLGLRYADDLYHVSFFGNADFENDWAELGPSAFERVRYQSFGFGMEDVRTRSYLMFHVVSGENLNSARVDQADLFTATDGRYLRLELDGSYARSADDGTGEWRSRGIGAAISARIDRPIILFKRASRFTFKVQDLGAIAWNTNSLRVPRDTTILYDGIEVDDVFDLDGVLTDSGSLQDTVGLGYETSGFLRPLPTLLMAGLSIEAPYRMTYAAELDVRNLPGYVPHGVVTARHRYGRNLFRADVAFGGFGGWRVGIGAERRLCGFLLGARIPNVVGMVSSNARGKALMLSLERAW